MSKCLVTGGAGFIGSHVVDQLIEAGHEVMIIDDLSTGKRENLNPKAKFIERDIYDGLYFEEPELAFLDNDFEFVFHLAALARIQPSIEDPIAAHQVNVDGTLEVLEYCRHTGAKLIFSGSSSIYEGETVPTKETDPKKPKSPYAMQKLMSEQYIRLYAQLYGLDYTVLRYFNVYGGRQIITGAYAAVVGIFLGQRANSNPLTITGNGEQRRDFTYVKDVALANVMAMKWSGTFNIGTRHNYSVNEIADMVGGGREYLPARIGEAKLTLADNSKALANGWAPTVDIKDWVAKQ